ncbi:hypothetical protein BRADI_3g00242v3 [Brachypodium distachyon]|uniref:Uncharacterized protein n=1 Tax=Brachypodium distachyon TaxID=15368 RepID=A0A0Q3LJR2_BRADI|nr:hypothetical protein BRADI_3g00242v3 [Brachypodium distachyon]
MAEEEGKRKNRRELGTGAGLLGFGLGRKKGGNKGKKRKAGGPAREAQVTQRLYMAAPSPPSTRTEQEFICSVLVNCDCHQVACLLNAYA